MKSFFIIFLTITFLQADELQRIESIINDIAKLRVENEECLKALESKTPLRVQTIKVDECKNEKSIIKDLRSKEISLEKSKNQIDLLQKEVKIKDDEINSLKNQLATLKENTKYEPKIVVKEIVKEKKIYPKDENVFPTLMPKETKKIERDSKQETIKDTKPTTYRLKKDSSIYNRYNGDEIFVWESGTSFTSNIATQNFIKITGYFVDREWRKAKEELWIKRVDVFER